MELEGLTLYLLFMSGAVNRVVEYAKPIITKIQERFEWKDESRAYMTRVVSLGVALLLVWSNPVEPSVVFNGFPVLTRLHPLAAIGLSVLLVAGGSNAIHGFTTWLNGAPELPANKAAG